MSENATLPILEAQHVTKTPGTRLLDLLAGWSAFVARNEVSDDEEAGLIDAGLTADEIAGMYQEAAAEVFDLEGEAEAAAVRRWVLDKVLPMLLRPSVPVGEAEPVSVAA